MADGSHDKSPYAQDDDDPYAVPSEDVPPQDTVLQAAEVTESDEVPPPAVELQYLSTTAFSRVIHRKDDTLIVPLTAELPPQCVRCNGACYSPPIMATYTYIPIWMTVTFVVLFFVTCVGAVILAVIAMLAQRKHKLAVYLCERHRNRRHLLMATAAAMAIVGLLIIFASVAYDRELRRQGIHAGIPMSAGAGLVVASVVAWMCTRVGRVVQIGRETIHLRGFGRPFLSQFPSQ